MIVTESEYQGKPVLQIKKDEKDRFPFSFGIGKAKLIMASLPEIEEFVKKHTVEELATVE